MFLKITFHGSVIFINEQSCLVTVIEAFMRMLLMDYMEDVVSKLGELSEDISSRVDLKPLLLLLLSISQDICIQLTSSSIAASDTSTTNTESLSTNRHSFSYNFILFLFTLMSVSVWYSDENCWFGQCSVSAVYMERETQVSGTAKIAQSLETLFLAVSCAKCCKRYKT